MTPDQARRAAFLLAALEDLEYELDVPQADRENKELWKYGLDPLSMNDADYQFKIEMCDDDGSMHNIATIDAGLAMKGCRFMVQEIKAELASLGVEVE